MMRNFTKLMLTLALLVAGVCGVKVYAGLVPGNEFTSVAALEGKTFAIVNKTDGKAICNQNAGNDYDLRYLPYADAFSAASLGYLFKIESTDGGYYLHSLNAEGNTYKLFGWSDAYFQSHSSDKEDCCFYIMKDGDGEGYAVWDIQYVADKGFTLKNIGTNGYFNDPTKRADSETPAYFTFCELVNANPIITIENSSNLVEIAQEQDQVEDETIHKASVSGPTDGVTTYTTTDGVCVIIKTFDVNVAGCDYITYKFAEPIPAGIQYAVWSKDGNKCVPLNAGITEFKYVFAEDASCAIAEDVIPQVSLVTVFAASGKIVKVKGIYKHKVSESTSARTYSFDKALDFTDVTGLEAYVATAFNSATATLTLSKVTKVPANTGLYLVGKDGNYEIPVIASADAIATNFLKPSGDGTITATTGENTNLVLAGTGANRGFHPVKADGNMGENKAYLQIPTADFNSISAARLNIVFEDETTAIKTVNDVKAADDAWYSINGVKLNAKPTQKGIYLNNGKKFAVK